jgi:hypothetical protein
MAEESMFGISNIFDSATADNVGIRDRALKVAQLQPGRASVYGASQAGGMLMQNLAGMAGMKTAQQEKAETITNILKGAQGMDQNNPNTLRNIANEFIQAGLPGIGQKFLDKARTMQTQDRTFGLETRKTDLLERQVVSEESKTKSDIKTQEAGTELNWAKFENLKYVQGEELDIARGGADLDKAKFDYAQVQDGILNELREGELDINRAKQMLAENAFEWEQEFKEKGVEIQKDQWEKTYNLESLNSKAERELKLAQKDNIIIETENYTYNNKIRNSLIEAQTSAAELKTKLDARQLELPASGEYMMQTTENGEQLLKFNPEINNYEVVTGKDGIALGLEEIEAQEYGLTADEARVYDNIWDQYKQRYYVAGAFPGEGNWKEDTPEFLDWAQANITGEEGLDIIVKGQGGTRKGYVNKLTAEFNNDEQLSDDQVAVVVEVPLDDNPMETRSEVQVFEVDTSSLAKELKVSEETINEVPKTVNGKENTLTNGQLLIQAVQTGDSELAATVESNMGKDIRPLDDTKKDEVNFRYQRFRGKVTKDMEATGNYVKRGNQWFVKKEK